jgi:hypothetical protein
MSRVLPYILFSWLVVAALFGLGYQFGSHRANAAWQDESQKAQLAAAAQYQAEVKRGEVAATHYLDEFTTLKDRYETLHTQATALRQRVPLFAGNGSRPLCPTGPLSVAAAIGAPAPSGATASVTDTPATQLPDGSAHGAAGLELSLGAVWVWNSALAGADTPAGSCGAATAASQPGTACAPSSGLTADDAWANQADNAQSCAADRQRYQRLIDFLKRRPSP